MCGYSWTTAAKCEYEGSLALMVKQVLGGIVFKAETHALTGICIVSGRMVRMSE
jgi:hypothetical protein